MPSSLTHDRQRPILFSVTREDPRVDMDIVTQYAELTGRQQLRLAVITSSGSTPLLLSALPHVMAIDAVDSVPAQTQYAQMCASCLREMDASSDIIPLFIDPEPQAQRLAWSQCYPLMCPDEPFIDQGRYDHFWRRAGSLLHDQLGISSAHDILFSLKKDRQRLQELVTQSLDDVHVWFPQAHIRQHKHTLHGVVMQRFEHFMQLEPSLRATERARWYHDVDALLGFARPEEKIPLWLHASWRSQIVTDHMHWHTDDMSAFLARQPDNHYDVIDVSNIMCWMDAARRTQLLSHALSALRDGGIFISRFFMGEPCIIKTPWSVWKSHYDHSLLIAGVQVLQKGHD